MKRFYIFMLLSLLCGMAMTSRADDNPFLVQHTSPRAAGVARRLIRQSCTLPLPSERTIHNLSISGSVSLPTDTSLVRVVMEDIDGRSWLVFEATQMLTNRTAVSFENYGEETRYLCGVTPQVLKVYVRDAALSLSGVTVDTCVTGVVYAPLSPDAREQLRIRQVQVKADSINSYNRKNGILWRAGVNSLGLWDSETKKRNLGITSDIYDTWGYEYYVSGIFEVGSRSSGMHTQLTSSHQSPYVPSFDWRDRHGRNWNTSVKHQGNSGYCTAFTAVAVTEALYNMYMNDSVNLDLSEQDAALYSNRYDNSIDTAVWRRGMTLLTPANYIVNKGVCFEKDMPFINHKVEEPKYRPEGLELVFANGCHRLYPNLHLASASDSSFQVRVDSVKSALIKHGPMVCGMYNHALAYKSRIAHALALVGYQDVVVGDTISLIKNDSYFKGCMVVNPDDSSRFYIGKTIWICKDSYGTNSGRGHDGYMYVLFNTYDCMDTPAYLELPITVPPSVDATLRIADEDGDGYYTWGFGRPKPAGLPDWVPDEQDGDDSDFTKGPLDNYGYAQENAYAPGDTIYIRENTTWNTLRHLFRPVVVQQGATLTVGCSLCGDSEATITVEDGGHLDVRSGSLEGVNVISHGKASVRRSMQDRNPQIRIDRTSDRHISLKRQ